MNKKGLVVEFVGIPGSGKSTLSIGVCNLLKKEAIKVETPVLNISRYNRVRRSVIKLYYLLNYIFFHPVRSVKSYRFILSTKQSSTKDLIKMILNYFFILKILDKYKDRLILLDQGYCQAFWSIYFSAEKDFNHEFFNENKLFWPDIIIEVEADREVVRRRLSERSGNKSRMETSENSFDGKFDRYKNIIDKIKKNLKGFEHSSWIKLENNNSEQLEKNKYFIKKIIKESMR